MERVNETRARYEDDGDDSIQSFGVVCAAAVCFEAATCLPSMFRTFPACNRSSNTGFAGEQRRPTGYLSTVSTMAAFTVILDPHSLLQIQA